jgi:hypothetical protein
MSIRPRLGVEVPEVTAQVARASNPVGTTRLPRVSEARRSTIVSNRPHP